MPLCSVANRNLINLLSQPDSLQLTTRVYYYSVFSGCANRVTQQIHHKISILIALSNVIALIS